MAFGFLKKLGKGVGKFIGKAAILPSRGKLKLFKGDIKGAASDIVGGTLRQAGIAGAILAAPVVGGLAAGAASSAAGAAGGIGGAAKGGFLSGAKSLLLDQFRNAEGGIDFGKLAETGLSVASLIQGSQQQGRSDDLLNRAISRDQARDLQTAPLREQFVQGLIGGGPEREDLSAQFADPSNPFFIAQQAGAPLAVTTGPVDAPPPGLPPEPLPDIGPQIGPPQRRRRVTGRGREDIDDRRRLALEQ